MNIDIISLLKHNDILLLFIILAGGFIFGRFNIAKIKLGNTIGVLIVSLFFGHFGFGFNTSALTFGFMLFIFAVGIEAGPNFFSVFLQDGPKYLYLSAIVIGLSFLFTKLLGYVFHLNLGLSSGLMAGSLTATPALVGAKSALEEGLAGGTKEQISYLINSLSTGYAISYIIGLVSLIIFAKVAPKLQKTNLVDASLEISKERGLENETQSKYLPIVRAYKVGEALEKWVNGRTLKEINLYNLTGCHIETLMRNNVASHPPRDTILRNGDEIAIVGFPDNQKKLDPVFRQEQELFNKDLLSLNIIETDIIVRNDNIIGKRVSELHLEDRGCFLSEVTRSQIKMPVSDRIKLNRGDVLKISGEQKQVNTLVDHVGFIAIHSQKTDLIAFCLFFILGILIG
ncbi:MAG: TrkA C-terminal domain-containing protein, partial [Psittacicella sp.]